jgi:peptidoglycan/xylan/chitin deacetylase (PgdA/CDA1 family)
MHATSRGFPLFITFDLDAETMWTARDPEFAKRPVLMSQGAYGWQTGVPRILELLRRHDLHITFFIPGIVVDQRPQVMEAILRDGHEIAHHSYTHSWPTKLTEDQEREEMEKGIEAIRKAAGYKPKGYRSPVGELSAVTLRLIKEYGFRYSSNFMNSDSPYLLEIDGAQTDIVELCWRWVMDDAVYFMAQPAIIGGRMLLPPRLVAETWIGEFDQLYGEDGRFLITAMHPQMIGQPSRIAVVEQLITHARDKGDVWMGRCDEMTDDIRQRLLSNPAAA